RRRGLRGQQAGARHQQRKQGDTGEMTRHHGGILPQFMGFCTVYYRLTGRIRLSFFGMTA
ncbi:MAG: hypothetical protein ACOVMK_11040, partial [Arenimonas sp.]